ncbi:hypothetical protein SAY86_014482 [Trapa natans]|uniref:Uncharacterized protein n=1 Tax=Trapa natans TaxID=22666 RepID=A0AAN7KSS6_TRANT|nr:hypothetical protein SAY86_014482 [Trapa natans]
MELRCVVSLMRLHSIIASARLRSNLAVESQQVNISGRAVVGTPEQDEVLEFLKDQPMKSERVMELGVSLHSELSSVFGSGMLGGREDLNKELLDSVAVGSRAKASASRTSSIRDSTLYAKLSITLE